MPYHWEKREKMADVRGTGMWAHVCYGLGAIFAILGIIAGAMNTSLGLEPVYWLLLSIAAFLAGVPFFMGVLLAWYLRTKR
jgi:hypothetical protein